MNGTLSNRNSSEPSISLNTLEPSVVEPLSTEQKSVAAISNHKSQEQNREEMSKPMI